MDKNAQAIQYMKEQNFEEAAKLFNEVIEKHPNDAVGYINFANLLMQVNENDRALLF